MDENFEIRGGNTEKRQRRKRQGFIPCFRVFYIALHFSHLQLVPVAVVPGCRDPPAPLFLIQSRINPRKSNSRTPMNGFFGGRGGALEAKVTVVKGCESCDS